MVIWNDVPTPVVVNCVPEELTAPSSREATIASAVKEQTAKCIKSAGSAVIPRPPAPAPAPVDLRAATADSYEICEAQADRAVRDPYVADPALLYLGEATADRYQAIWDADQPRTVGTVLAVLLATGAVTLLAGRRIARPIHALTTAVQRMEAGDRTARVPVKGRRQDEVGRLAHAFNAMAVSMEENERQRQAMVSDIAHELRNPLTNVRGYLEGVQDGLVPLDDALVASLLEESALLGRLVDDLQDLALADAGRLHLHPEPLDAADLVEQVVAAHRPAAAAAGVAITADRSRAHAGAGGPRPVAPGAGEPGRQCPALHPGRRAGDAHRLWRRRPGGHRGGRHRCGYRRRAPPPHLRPLLPGRRLPQPGDRRQRPGPGHHPPPGRSPRRHDRSAEHRRNRFHLHDPPAPLPGVDVALLL